MSRLILASLVALLGLTTGAAFATNDYLAQQAASQAAFLGGSNQLAFMTEGGAGGTKASPAAGSNSGPKSTQSGSKSTGTGGKTGGGVTGNGNNTSDPDKQGSDPGSTRGGDKNPGARSPSNPGAGGDPTGKDSTPGGKGTNPGNTPGGGGGCTGGGGCDSGAQQAQRDAVAKAARTQDYAKNLANADDKQASLSDIRAAKEAAEARLSQVKTNYFSDIPSYNPPAPAPNQNYFSDIPSYNPPAPAPNQNYFSDIPSYNLDKEVQDAIAAAKLGIGVDTYTDPTYGEVTITPAGYVTTPDGILDDVTGVTYTEQEMLDAYREQFGTVQTMVKTGVVNPDGTAQLKSVPEGTPGSFKATPVGVSTLPGGKLAVTHDYTGKTTPTGGMTPGKDTPAAKPSSAPAQPKATAPAQPGAKPAVNRTAPVNTGRGTVDPTAAGKAFAAQKAAESASKVAAAKAQQPKVTPAKQPQAPAKQQQPSKVATNPKTSPNGQGTGGEGGGGVGNQGRTQGKDGKGTAEQGDGQDNGISPQGNGQGTGQTGNSTDGQGKSQGDTAGQGDSGSTGTDTQSPNGSNGIEGGVVGGQGTGNGTGDGDSEGTDTDGQDTGEGSGDVNGDDSDGEGTIGGGSGTPQPQPNLTERIAQLTQPKVGSWLERLFQFDEPSENVEVAPPMTEEEYEAGPKLEGAFTAIGQPDEETESDEEEDEGGEETETPSDEDPRPLYRDNMAVGEDDPIWDKVHPDLKRDKDRILDQGKIRTGALIAADAVFRHAEKKGVPMHVAVGGGADNHSENHLAGPKGAKVGESIDISPGGREITKADVPWSKFKADPVEYAKIAAAAIQLLDGKARIGVPLNRKNGLHVQDTGNEGLNKPTMSWVYGKDTIGAGRTGKKGGFRSQLQSGAIKEQYAGEVTSLYAPATVVVRKPKEKTVPELPKTVADIPKVVEKAKAIEVKVQAALENPTILKVDMTKFKMPEWTKGVKLGGGGDAQTGQADAKQPETKQPETPQPGTTRSLSSEEILNQIDNKAETETKQPTTRGPSTPVQPTKTITFDGPSDLKNKFNQITNEYNAGKINLDTAVERARTAAKVAGTEVAIDQVETLLKNPDLEVVFQKRMTLGELKPYLTPEQLAQIPFFAPNSTSLSIGIAVPVNKLTAKITKTVPVNNPASTDDEITSVEPADDEVAEPETPRTGLTADEEPLPPGATEETTWKFTVRDENGDTIAHVEKQRKDGSINLEGGVIGQPVTTEPDGTQNVTIGERPMTVTIKNGRVVSIKDAPQVSPESEPETETEEPADVPVTENPIKKGVKAVVNTVKTIFNFIFGDGKGGETNNQPGMGGNGTSTRNE